MRIDKPVMHETVTIHRLYNNALSMFTINLYSYPTLKHIPNKLSAITIIH